MLSNSKIEADPSSKKRTKEQIDKTLSNTFDEFFIEISLGSRFHPTEKHNRDVHLQEHPFSKIYDLINSYHAFCKLCEQHFYSRSMADDINSFFQKHINTSYHKQMRVFGLPPNDAPIFTWEEKFHSGRCNICDMPGLNSFVLNTKFDPLQLVKLHFCVWDQENRKTNEKVLRKLTLLKKFCGLKIFGEIYIKTINGSGVCLLCSLKLPWSGEKARCHLVSEGHYQKFCVLLKKCFNFSPKDALNGFNLEMITRWLIRHEPSVPERFIDCYEWKICLHHSNSIENPYSEEKDNFSYSPNNVKNLLKTEVASFIPNEKYFLYNIPFYPVQMCSELHQVKALNFDMKSFYASENQQKQLHIIENYQRLKLGLEKLCAPPPSDKSVKYPKQTPSGGGVNYLKKLFMKKLKWVAVTFVSTSGGNIFCQICDQYLPKTHKIVHLNSFNHKSEEKKWKQLKVNFENTKFMEPFQETKNTLVCLLCGAVFDTNNFFSHLKGGTHMRKFEWYSDLKSSIPISSALVIRTDLSCYCTICNSVLSKKVPLTSLKAALKNVRLHWPCPMLKKKPNLTNESAVITEKSEELNKKNQKACDVSITQSTSGKASKESEMRSHNMSSPKNAADFKKVEKMLEKTLENIVTVFEKKIITNAFDKSAYSFSRLDNSILIATKEKIKQSAAGRETSCGCDQFLKCSCPTRSSSKDERKTDFTEKRKKIVKNELRAQKTENNIKKQKEGESADKEEKKSDLNDEILLLEEERRSSVNQDLIHLLQDPQKLMNCMLTFNMQAMTASESPVERKREELVCNTIISAVLEYFPQSRCYPFGSRLSGLMLSNSDLDVFLDCGDMYEGFRNTTPSSERKLVNKVAGLLRKKQEITEIIVVDKARVPIISFLHKPTLMRCDLSFKNGLSIQNTLLIKFMLSLDWRVRPLILFLKHWAKLNGLHGPPNFSSYALAMLVIYYLEQLERPVLPTIESLQNSYVGRRTTIGGWDCSINVNTQCIPKSENMDSLPQLLMGLFGFYGSFDYSANIISPLTGKPLPREAFSHSGFAKLPMCYKRHILNIPIPIENLVNSSILICIMDPFDLSHILTKSFTSRGLRMFIGFCQASEMHLEKGLSVSDLKQ